MNIFKKLFVPTNEQQRLIAYENWSVRWVSRYGEYSTNTQKEAEFFSTEESANQFAEQLRKAFKLIKHSSSNIVEVIKTK